MSNSYSPRTLIDIPGVGVEELPDTVVRYIADLVSERDRLRAALEAAPEPLRASTKMWDVDYVRWYHTTRAEALR